MRRRRVLASAAILAIPLQARAQRRLPMVGFLRSTPAAPFADIVAAFGEGLAEAGFIEGQDVVIEYRWADNRAERLPALAAELIAHGASVIIGNRLAVEAARAATSTVPIVFVVGDDPVLAGLVASFARPGGNVTGVTFFGGRRLDAKRLELLHELAPSKAAVAVLVDPGSAGDGDGLAELEAVARALGRHLVIVRAGNAAALDTAFAAMPAANVGALLVSGSPVFTSLRRELVALAARTSLPAIYDQRDQVIAGGLISYGASFTEAYRQAGVYAGRILRGEAPAHLPVLQPTRFELVVNLGTARALGLTVPPSILLRADEVIE